MKKLLKNILLTTIMLGAISCGWLNEDLDAKPTLPVINEDSSEKSVAEEEIKNPLVSTDETEVVVKKNIPK